MEGKRCRELEKGKGGVQEDGNGCDKKEKDKTKIAITEIIKGV